MVMVAVQVARRVSYCIDISVADTSGGGITKMTEGTEAST
jgi:hypothetical protein